LVPSFDWFLLLFGFFLWLVPSFDWFLLLFVPPFYWFLPLVCSSLCLGSFFVQFLLCSILSLFLSSRPSICFNPWTVSPFEQFRHFNCPLNSFALWSGLLLDRFLLLTGPSLVFHPLIGFILCSVPLLVRFNSLFGFGLWSVSPFDRFLPLIRFRPLVGFAPFPLSLFRVDLGPAIDLRQGQYLITYWTNRAWQPFRYVYR